MTEEQEETKKNITEQEYLNICDDFKNQMERKNEELKAIKMKYMKTKKIASRCYGLITELQDYLENLSDIGGDPVYEHLSNAIRYNISHILFLQESKQLGISMGNDSSDEEQPPVFIQVNYS